MWSDFAIKFFSAVVGADCEVFCLTFYDYENKYLPKDTSMLPDDWDHGLGFWHYICIVARKEFLLKHWWMKELIKLEGRMKKQGLTHSECRYLFSKPHFVADAFYIPHMDDSVLCNG